MIKSMLHIAQLWRSVVIHINTPLKFSLNFIKPLQYNSRFNNLLFPHHYRPVYRNSAAFFTLSARMTDNKYAADYAKMGTSGCKKCKQKLPKGGLRIAKVVANPFSEEAGSEMKMYHHAACIFETFVRARGTTKIIEETEDLLNFDILTDEDKDVVRNLIKETMEKKGTKKTPKKKTPSKTTPPAMPKPSPAKPSPVASMAPSKDSVPSSSTSSGGSISTLVLSPEDQAAADKDNSFRTFRRICAEIAEEPSYTNKTGIVQHFLKKGSSGNGYHGDLYLLLKLLLPGVIKTVYSLNSKTIVKIFSTIFGTPLKAMQEDLDNGDVAETVRIFFEQSAHCPPIKKATLSMQDVDRLLTELSHFTKEDDQQAVLLKITKKCTANDLKMVVRLIKHDLRINSGAKHMLDALDPNAYQAFQVSRDLRDVVDRCLEARSGSKPGMSKSLSVRANLMTPILPMLAEACKSVDFAFKRCPNGMYAEIKYDGERVQVHKQGDEFSYFSRSLKPVLPHKVNHFKDYIPLAFPHGNDIILDAEVLLIDIETSKPLPFGSLGKHKKEAFQDANVCLFVFDCIHFNGETLINKSIKQRRKFLEENMIEVPNRILFSEMTHITQPDDLKDLIMKVIREGLEGLVLKDIGGIYEPGKRHWLKVKKDYLAAGAMADTADLVVLGAYFGTGRQGGMMSGFLMGVHDPSRDRWLTVTKCASGYDDATLLKLNEDFSDMVKIRGDFSKVPDWLSIDRKHTPDFVVADPRKSVVWEITGAEFTQTESHTADGISIRFPRCTKMRDDKTWKTATNLPELKALFKASKEHSEIPDLLSPSKGGGKFQKKIKPEPENSTSNNSNGIESKNGAEHSNEITVKKEEETPQKTGKRKSDTSPGTTPAKKGKPECKFGSTCYQSNPDHKKQYYHPAADEPSQNDKHLPNVFTGMRLHIPTSIDNGDVMKRYITAFDGEIVSAYEMDTATHLVQVDTKEKFERSQPQDVPASWVWRCIKQKTLLPLK